MNLFFDYKVQGFFLFLFFYINFCFVHYFLALLFHCCFFVFSHSYFVFIFLCCVVVGLLLFHHIVAPLYSYSFAIVFLHCYSSTVIFIMLLVRHCFLVLLH